MFRALSVALFAVVSPGALIAQALTPPTQPAPPADAATAAVRRWFAADAAARATFVFEPALDERLCTRDGDARLRDIAFAALVATERELLLADHGENRVRAGGVESPFVVKTVGTRPEHGWPLVIAMHGGGNAGKQVNDSQWRHMQIYYRAHPEAGGYLYCALRAPNDEWNGFYFDGFYPLIEKLIRQFVVCADVDPDHVVAIGYSHGGYGAFAVGPKLPHRFAAVHASASAPTDGESSPVGLHTLRFSFMVGGEDRAYGRRERCEAFAKALGELQAAHPGEYATEFTLVEGNGHTGLPDRDLLARILPAAFRTPTPARVAWELTDGVVQDHYWLRVERPARGGRIDAELRDQRLVVAAKDVTGVAAWLDARSFDPARPLTVVVDGKERTVEARPSLRTLCETMLQRGDPGLAATVVVPLR